MRHFLDFERPIAELEGKIEELRRMSEPEGINIAEEVARLSAVADRQLRATYGKLTALAENPGRPPSGPPQGQRLHRRADHRVHPARRRPRLRRRRRGAGRAGPVPRPSRRGAGHRKGLRYRVQGEAQFRHGAAGGLPQGAPPDRTGRPVRPAGAELRRYLRRLPRHRGRGSAARPKPSPARSRPAWKPRSRWSPPSSARAAPAAPSHSPPATGC